MEPVISIIIPCYNHGKYIRDAVQSVQELQHISYPYEIIIVNDGSTDEFTLTILDDLKKEGHNILQQENMGLGTARNNGIQLAKGKYILPLDSDNKVCAPYLTTAIDILERNANVSIVYSDAIFFGEKTGRSIIGNYNLQKLMICNYIDACAVYRKEAWKNIGGYAIDMPAMGYEDWDMWLNCSFKGYRFYYLEEIGFEYRFINNSMLRTIDEQDQKKMNVYIENKYSAYLNKNYLNDLFINSFSNNKKALLKLLLVVFCPKIIDALIKKKKIANKNFI
jgi:glycosyltransferase involved in cell wall biosynthesis